MMKSPSTYCQISPERCPATSLRLVFSTLLVLALCLFWTSAGRAAAPAPIRVAADHMSSIEKTNSVVFTGAVDARQADVRIRTDKMTVYYNKAKAGGKTGKKGPVTRKVDKMVCVGNVKITQKEWLGTSKKAIYLAGQRQFILIGNAKAWQGQNMVSGDKIIYYLDEGRSEVVADRTRATVGASGGKKKKQPDRVKMTILQ